MPDFVYICKLNRNFRKKTAKTTAMADYRIIEVTSKKDLNRFIKFPDDLYRECSQYVPALHSDQRKSLTSVSTLSYCTRKMWLVVDCEGGKSPSKAKVVGRICAMVNPRYNELYQKKRARFGWFDTIKDIEVARLLLTTAEKWAKEQGMNEIHGPLYYNTLGKQGMLVEGFENTPPFNCLYNYPYYNDFVSELGYNKECDWLQYKMIADQDIDPKIIRISGMLKQRYNLHEGDIEKLKKNKAMVRKFFEMYNDSFKDAVHNFIPFTDEEIEEEASSVMKFLNNKTSVIILDENEDLVAFGITFPSISEALKKCHGHLFPFGWIHLLRALHQHTTVDLMLNGAVPAWQNKGVSAVYHCAMSERYKASHTKHAIANPQIENNSAVNVWAKYDNELFMRRRCYIKDI